MKIWRLTFERTNALLAISTAAIVRNSFPRFNVSLVAKRSLLHRSIVRMSSTDDIPRGKGRNEAQVQAMRQQINDEDSNELTSSSPLVRKNAWDSLWQDNVTPWDLGKPTPVLIAELKSHWDNTVSSEAKDAKSTTTFRSLVPGCGAGYDLVMLALHHEKWLNQASNGFQPSSAVVVGLDISETSLLERASTVVSSGLPEGKKDAILHNTRVDLMNGDFFNDMSDWSVVRSFGSDNDGQPIRDDDPQNFDFIFDYTFFCALHPTMRSSWGKRMAQLLTPGTGRLLTIIFPVLPATADRMDGPPYPVTVDDYRAALEPHGIVMDERTASDDDISTDKSSSPVRIHPETVGPRVGKELVCWWVRNSESHLDARHTKKLKST